MTRTELLNLLVDKYGYQTYLEVGVRDPALNFDKVKAPQKLGCDPCPSKHRPGVAEMTSNEFFAWCDDEKWQLIFVDGDHSRDQSWQDMVNSVNHLAPGGTVVVHDVNPLEACHQGEHYVPTPGNPGGYFMGEVWRSWLRARMEWPTLTVVVRGDTDSPSDCGIIQPGSGLRCGIREYVHGGVTEAVSIISYEEFKQKASDLLDLMPWKEAEKVLMREGEYDK